MRRNKAHVNGKSVHLYEFQKESNKGQAAASGDRGQDARPGREELQEPVDVAPASGGEGGVLEESPSSQRAGPSNAQPVNVALTGNDDCVTLVRPALRIPKMSYSGAVSNNPPRPSASQPSTSQPVIVVPPQETNASQSSPSLSIETRSFTSLSLSPRSPYLNPVSPSGLSDSSRLTPSSSSPRPFYLSLLGWGPAKRFSEEGLEADEEDVLLKDLLNLSMKPKIKILLQTNHFEIKKHPTELQHCRTDAQFRRNFRELDVEWKKHVKELVLAYDGGLNVFVKHSDDVAKLLEEARKSTEDQFPGDLLGPLNKLKPHEIPYALKTILQHQHILDKIVRDEAIFPIAPKERMEHTLQGTDDLVALDGWIQAVQYVEDGKLTLAVDQARSLFCSTMNMVQMARKLLHKSIDLLRADNENRVEESREKFFDLVKDLKVTVPIAEGRYKIIGVSFASETDEDNWQRKHGELEMRGLWWLEIDVLGPLPLELCQVAIGQKVQMSFTPEQRYSNLDFLYKGIYKTKDQVMELRRNLNFGPIPSSFGISIDEHMLDVCGTILNAPRINYQPRADSTTKEAGTRQFKGYWKRPINGSFYKPVSVVNRWAVAVFVPPDHPLRDSRPENMLNKCINSLTNYAEAQTGLKFGNVGSIICLSPELENADAMFRRAKKEVADLKFILVFVPYARLLIEQINRLGDTKYGIPIVYRYLNPNLAAVDLQEIGNDDKKEKLARLINSKLGGINYTIGWKWSKTFDSKKVMFLGAITHKPTLHDPQGSPTIAAIVGSLDEHPARYAFTVRAQKHDQEVIGDIDAMLGVLLKRFEMRRGCKPDRIVMYRGVSEKNMATVVQMEIEAIKKVFGEVEITYILVEKRPVTRLFRENQMGIGIIPFGTVVDTVITDPFYHDFYLCSSIKGSSRPSKYTVLRNDHKLSSEKLQFMTYDLCYAPSARTRLSTTPVPQHYADLVCRRAREHLNGTVGSVEEMNDMIQIHDNLVENDVLYFL